MVSVYASVWIWIWFGFKWEEWLINWTLLKLKFVARLRPDHSICSFNSIKKTTIRAEEPPHAIVCYPLMRSSSCDHHTRTEFSMHEPFVPYFKKRTKQMLSLQSHYLLLLEKCITKTILTIWGYLRVFLCVRLDRAVVRCYLLRRIHLGKLPKIVAVSFATHLAGSQLSAMFSSHLLISIQPNVLASSSDSNWPWQQRLQRQLVIQFHQ